MGWFTVILKLSEIGKEVDAYSETEFAVEVEILRTSGVEDASLQTLGTAKDSLSAD
jgi:hypothetical protein